MTTKKRPLLLFPTPIRQERSRPRSGAPRYGFPGKSSQAARFEPQLKSLAAALGSQRAAMSASAEFSEPEKVLVFEVIGSVNDFMRAVEKAGLEWLTDIKLDDLQPDDEFYALDDKGERCEGKLLEGRLYLTMTNQQALKEMLSLWRIWESDKPLPRGYAPWKHVFNQLKDVRFWNAQDRVEGTGLREDWSERLELGHDAVPFEVELWYRGDRSLRDRAEQHAQNLIGRAGGQVVRVAMIDEIRYHALAGTIPALNVESFLEGVGVESELVRCDDVMFLRPSGQGAFLTILDEEPTESEVPSADLPEGDPIAALLDGMPVQRHPLLNGRLIIDDPEDWADEYTVESRSHGTSMASLIVHGDLSWSLGPIDTPLIVRPIMKPGPKNFSGRTLEHVPDDVLPADILRTAITRMFEGQRPIAPSVRVVNLSVCDRYRPFSWSMSAWARCLDWLAFRYGILFIVSSGNCAEPIPLDIPKWQMTSANENDRRDAFLAALPRTWQVRRLLSPAESINALTVGSVNTDAAGAVSLASGCCEPYPTGTVLPSPFTRIGPGYRRSVKPDLVNSGGRAVYSEDIASRGPNAVARIRKPTRAPGHLVAAPHPSAARQAATVHSVGTSNAAALTTRSALLLHSQVIKNVLESQQCPTMGRRHQSVLLKALLVHGSSWPADQEAFDQVLESLGSDGRQRRNWGSRIFGFGIPDVDRVAYCTDQRASLLGWGDIEPEEACVYQIPLPPSLSYRREVIRLISTVAWFTPINARHHDYRRAALKVEYPGIRPKQAFGAISNDVDHLSAARGTIYHQVHVGSKAAVFGDDDYMALQINCRPAAGGLEDSVPYAVVVTLEVGEESDIPIYEEVRARVEIPVSVQT